MVDIEDVGSLARLSRIAELLTLRIGVAALFIAAGVCLLVLRCLLSLILLSFICLLGCCFSLCLEDFGGLLHALHHIGQRLLDASCFRAFGTFFITFTLLAFYLFIMYALQLVNGLSHI